ncbi:MAG: hypothetical protein Kow0096_12050 [Thiohalomonadaceae bacterium]
MDTGQLEKAIAQAVAGLAGPDEARLAALLARLEQVPVSRPEPRRSFWPWLLLAAAGAAAAGAGYWYAQHAGSSVPADVREAVVPQSGPQVPAASESAGVAAPAMPEDDAAPAQNTTIIYRQ